MQRQTFTVAEVAVLLGISRSKAYDLVAEGAIPTLPLKSRRRLIARAALEELLGAPLSNSPIDFSDAKSTHTSDEREVSSTPTRSSPPLLATSHSCTRGGQDSGR